jgi:hypothetical protein
MQTTQGNRAMHTKLHPVAAAACAITHLTEALWPDPANTKGSSMLDQRECRRKRQYTQLCPATAAHSVDRRTQHQM